VIGNLPPAMAAAMLAAEEAEERQRLLDEAAAEDDQKTREHMADLAERSTVAMTGRTPAELRMLAENLTDARDAAGWDPLAPVGTPAHPEILVDGASLDPTPHRPTPTLAEPAAARSSAEYLDTIEGQLARAQAEAAAWDSPAIRRQRQLSASALEIRRRSSRPPVVGVPREIRRASTAAPGPGPGRRPRLHDGSVAVMNCGDPRCCGR
jgi:hypothetical protein